MNLSIAVVFRDRFWSQFLKILNWKVREAGFESLMIRGEKDRATGLGHLENLGQQLDMIAVDIKGLASLDVLKKGRGIHEYQSPFLSRFGRPA